MNLDRLKYITTVRINNNERVKIYLLKSDPIKKYKVQQHKNAQGVWITYKP